MEVKITKWQHQTANIPVRYYVNHLDVPASVKVWVEQTKNGRYTLRTNPSIDLKFQDLLDTLVAQSIITTQEAGNPPKDLFERLSGDGAKTNSQQPITKMIKTSQSPITLKDQVTINIDHREPKELFNAFQAIAGVVVNRTELKYGDISFEGGIVERKSAFDFSQSIVDRRLFVQSDEIAAAPSLVLKAVIVEGNPYEIKRLDDNAIDGALSYLAVLQGLTVLYSGGFQHTANLVAKMASHAAHGLGYELAYREAKPKDINDHALYILQGLPGIGVEMAKVLICHFGSLSAVFNATAEELQAVDRIGKKTASAIRGLLDHAWQGKA